VGGVQPGPLGTAATNWPIVPAPGDYVNGEFGGMMIGRGNRSTRTKPAPVPLCPPHSTWPRRARSRAAAVGSQRLTAWAMAQPYLHWNITLSILDFARWISQEGIRIPLLVSIESKYRSWWLWRSSQGTPAHTQLQCRSVCSRHQSPLPVRHSCLRVKQDTSILNVTVC
jgi:hypothetical protein